MGRVEEKMRIPAVVATTGLRRKEHMRWGRGKVHDSQVPREGAKGG